MDNLIFVTIGRFFIYGLILFLLNACANKDVARKAYENGDYKTSSKIWKRWADAGYGNANLKLAQMANKKSIEENDEYILEHALKAYEAGENKAAFILENIYTKKHMYDQAIIWMEKGDIKRSSNRDLDTHLYLIEHAMKDFQKQNFYLEKIASLVAPENNAAYKLGKFYQNSNSIFYNIDKSLYYYDIAYRANNMRAGVELALIKINVLHKNKEGIKLLREIVAQGDAKAALLIGRYIYRDMPSVLDKYNKPCIACTFKDPLDFYVKKLTLMELHNLYIEKNIVPWFYKAYKMGNIEGMFSLISLDIVENNFLSPDQKTYSHMNLDETTAYLYGVSNKFFKAKMLLAQLYVKYPNLHKVDIAEQIYVEYMDHNATDAQWHLYQFNKKFHPESEKKDIYLKYLVEENFTKAKIEDAYNKIINHQEVKKSYHLLEYEANRNNVSALQYLASLLSKEKGAQAQQKFCLMSKRICEEVPLNEANDLKIANYYFHSNTNTNLIKAATIYQFYAENNSSKAQYALANIYTKFCDFNNSSVWLKKAKNLGNEKALFAYDRMILEGTIDGNVTSALENIKRSANQENRDAILILANLYAKGNLVEFSPEKALSLYKEAMDMQYESDLAYKIVTLYENLNVDHYYDEKIIEIYHNLIYVQKEEKFKINLSKFLIRQERVSEAKQLLKTLSLKHYPEAKYLLYVITGKMFYINDASVSYNGNLLLTYAQQLAKHSRRKKALLYAFRASLCDTRGSGEVIYNLMSLINDSSTIRDIYKKAKTFNQCSNFK